MNKSQSLLDTTTRRYQAVLNKEMRALDLNSLTAMMHPRPRVSRLCMVPNREQSRLKEGDRVAYKFRGDSWQSTAEVVRVRETKEKTDAGDTVTTIHYDVKECETAPSPPGESKAIPRAR